ncbi:hypothetical protein F7D01_06340 [Erythrobacter sp. 3-20A1M]|uniref:hypothetical protein n=1 Tax=Erythrobacter sp. 3-20A1M TaxID=2653850 RepID=UPI001BFC7259|nr:hypothetical protein [Erythrobacter sp. 3-20A1M]QWC56763.1 hypothetical protein F7D01_06340 [Erythrobacter sp. 3-20A1M]
MSVLAAILLAQAPAAVPAPTQPTEITVIGKKLANWKGGVFKRGGKLMCRTERSTGDAQLDAIRCGAMLACVRPVEGQIDAIMGSDLNKATKRKRFDALLDSTKPCLESYEDAAVAKMLARRAEGPASR